MAHHQLVQLAASGDVLILERERAASLRDSKDSLYHRIIDRGEHVTRAGEEAREPAVALRDRRRLRGARCERHAPAGKSIEPLAAHFTIHDPQGVAKVLFAQRDLCLYGELDIGERRRWDAFARDPSEDPRGPLLVHQSASAVDRIDDDSQLSALGIRA